MIDVTYCGDHFAIYKSLCCTPKTNIMLYVNYISIKNSTKTSNQNKTSYKGPKRVCCWRVSSVLCVPRHLCPQRKRGERNPSPQTKRRESPEEAGPESPGLEATKTKI